MGGAGLLRDQYVMMTLDDWLARDHRIRVADALLEGAPIHARQE
ncbi:MAG TPA: hypothetical protein PLD73_04210 [Candidatus Hydrogenedentes bacterium]|jgi:hypothetical protein|nr:hypothetical protein [Candidatus Hydrogenedentota bacterium]